MCTGEVSALDDVYARAGRQLAGVHYLKPAEGAEGLPARLAPLLFLQGAANHSELSEYPDRPGTLIPGDRQYVDMRQATVYFSTGALTTSNGSLPQITYAWRYQMPEKKGKPIKRLHWQGIRLTLDSHGNPVIWEVLNESSKRQVLFVSRRLEDKAVAHHRKPAPGRRYAIELPLSAAPNTVVARVIDDGPVPMGPAVYVAQGTRDIITVLCRCMPPQFTKVLSTSNYSIAPDVSTQTNFRFESTGALPLSQALRAFPD